MIAAYIGEMRALQTAVANAGTGGRHSRLAERLAGDDVRTERFEP